MKNSTIKKINKGVYFYQGFEAPEKVANNIQGLLEILKSNDFEISENYVGIINDEIVEELEWCMKHDEDFINDNMNDINDMLGWGLYYTDNIKPFIQFNKSVGLDDLTYLNNL